MTSLKTSIKTITYLSDIGCLEIQGASLTVSYKITYEHRDGDQIRMEEVLFHSEHEPTKDEIHDAVRKDTVRFNSPSNGVTAVSGFKVISVVPVP